MRYLRIINLFLFIVLALASYSQKFYSKSMRISFFSRAPMENISAINRTGACIVDASSGAVQFSVLIKGFDFPKALMQEHFNENYLESDKYPRGDFKGMIVNNNEIHYDVPGSYTAHVKGQLTIHGITRDVEASGNISVGSDPELVSDFTIQLTDYHIKIPALVKDNISNTIKITVAGKLEPLKD